MKNAVQKIILLLFILIVAVPAGSSITFAHFIGAHFVDEESSNHSLSEGTLNLVLNNTFTTFLIFPCNIQLKNFDDELLRDKNVTTSKEELLQGIKNSVTFDQGEFQIIKNNGTTNGKLDIAIDNFTINGPTEAAQMAVWINKNEDGIFDQGTDISLKSNGMFVTDNNNGNMYFDTIKNYNNKKWSAVVGNMHRGDKYKVNFLWKIPIDDIDNILHGLIGNRFGFDRFTRFEIHYILQDINVP